MTQRLQNKIYLLEEPTTIVLKSLRGSWGVVRVPTILRLVISFHQLWEVFLDLQTKIL